MTAKSFSISNLNTLLSHLPAVNVIDPVPGEAIDFLLHTYQSSICVSGEQLTQEMTDAVINQTMEDFRHKYCEAPFLIIHLDKDDACKTAVQNELVLFLNVRQYKGLPSVLLSKDPLTSYPLTNESLIGYARVNDSIRK